MTSTNLFGFPTVAVLVVIVILIPVGALAVKVTMIGIMPRLIVGVVGVRFLIPGIIGVVVCSKWIGS